MVEPIVPIVIVGAGPHALSLVLTLLEEDSAGEFTEAESTMLSYWRKKQLAPHRVNLRDCIRVIDPSGCWCANWNANFELFGISHLRSPLGVHLDPLRPEGLRDFATSAGRSREVTPPPATIPFNKKNRAFASNTSMFSENDRQFFGCPSQALFATFNDQLVHQYGVAGLVEKEQAGFIEPIFTEGDKKHPSSYRVHCASGRVFQASKVVVAVGTQRLPRRPQWSLTCRATYHSTDLVAQGLATVAARYAKTRPHVLIVGGGLTSVHLAKQALRWGARYVTLLTRSQHFRVQPYDVPLEWLSPTLRDKMRAEFFAERDPLGRLNKIKAARGRGSVTQAALDELMAATTPHNYTHRGGVQIVAVNDIDGHLHVQLDVAETIIVDEVILATGADIDIARDPLFKAILPLGMTVTGGFPNVDDELRVAPGINVFVMGAYGALRLGPTAGNLMGGRAGANLLAEVLLEELLPPVVKTAHHHMRCLCGKENMFDLLR
ncbi:hypothetical protein ACHHYP_01953 [Achlya hypogyna]|uniref:FAD/NAD(P)-binding domain-containing protein n=1 Tax=Achlya hypogyna TaxID=1202772 RepID=A0A1V9ZSR5_ACHHY|nr:hypothetical protein ACHHYP_01953 [Achlya hypogyna]